MSTDPERKRWIVALVCVAVVGVFASAVVAAQFDDGSELAAAIDEAPLQRVADIAAEEGAPALGVYTQLTETGHVCIWEAPSPTSRERGGGCNTADDPLNGQAVSATLSYDGGPAVSTVRRASVFGLALTGVAGVRVLMDDGSFRTVKLKNARIGSGEYQAFGYRFKKADLKKGIGPVAIVAYDAAGHELGRQTTGIG
jgi:hypothetical protein